MNEEERKEREEEEAAQAAALLAEQRRREDERRAAQQESFGDESAVSEEDHHSSSTLGDVHNCYRSSTASVGPELVWESVRAHMGSETDDRDDLSSDVSFGEVAAIEPELLCESVDEVATTEPELPCELPAVSIPLESPLELKPEVKHRVSSPKLFLPHGSTSGHNFGFKWKQTQAQKQMSCGRPTGWLRQVSSPRKKPFVPRTLPHIQSPKSQPAVLLMVEENVSPICAKLRVRCAERRAASLGASQASFDFSVSDIGSEADNSPSMYLGSSWFGGRLA